MEKVLIEYANQHQIILELNEKGKNGYYPLLESIYKNNIEMVNLWIEYANQHQIIKNIKYRWLHTNNLTGSIPLEIGKLINLQYLLVRVFFFKYCFSIYYILKFNILFFF